MSRRPEKRDISILNPVDISDDTSKLEYKLMSAYNQACDEWEAYYNQQDRFWKDNFIFQAKECDRVIALLKSNLPSEEEIAKIIIDATEITEKKGIANFIASVDVVASAISKRLRNE